MSIRTGRLRSSTLDSHLSEVSDVGRKPSGRLSRLKHKLSVTVLKASASIASFESLKLGRVRTFSSNRKCAPSTVTSPTTEVTDKGQFANEMLSPALSSFSFGSKFSPDFRRFADDDDFDKDNGLLSPTSITSTFFSTPTLTGKASPKLLSRTASLASNSALSLFKRRPSVARSHLSNLSSSDLGHTRESEDDGHEVEGWDFKCKGNEIDRVSISNSEAHELDDHVGWSNLPSTRERYRSAPCDQFSRMSTSSFHSLDYPASMYSPPGRMSKQHLQELADYTRGEGRKSERTSFTLNDGERSENPGKGLTKFNMVPKSNTRWSFDNATSKPTLSSKLMRSKRLSLAYPDSITTSQSRQDSISLLKRMSSYTPRRSSTLNLDAVTDTFAERKSRSRQTSYAGTLGSFSTVTASLVASTPVWQMDEGALSSVEPLNMDVRGVVDDDHFVQQLAERYSVEGDAGQVTQDHVAQEVVKRLRISLGFDDDHQCRSDKLKMLA